MEGRQTIVDAAATAEANTRLEADSIPTIGQPVRVARGADAIEGVVTDAWQDGDPGITVESADGTALDVTLAELQEAGAEITALPMPAAAADLDSRREEIEKEAEKAATEYQKDLQKEAKDADKQGGSTETAGGTSAQASAGESDQGGAAEPGASEASQKSEQPGILLDGSSGDSAREVTEPSALPSLAGVERVGGEADATVSPPQPILRANGEAYKTKQAAALAARNRKMDAVPVEVPGGWALQEAAAEEGDTTAPVNKQLARTVEKPAPDSVIGMSAGEIEQLAGEQKEIYLDRLRPFFGAQTKDVARFLRQENPSEARQQKVQALIDDKMSEAQQDSILYGIREDPGLVYEDLERLANEAHDAEAMQDDDTDWLVREMGWAMSGMDKTKMKAVGQGRGSAADQGKAIKLNAAVDILMERGLSPNQIVKSLHDDMTQSRGLEPHDADFLIKSFFGQPSEATNNHQQGHGLL